MDLVAYSARLDAQRTIIAELFTPLTDAEARWKPATDDWSALEVINHLADEEADDFRTRLRLTLEDANAAWPPIDPNGWAIERAYNQRDPAQSLRRFLTERDRSLVWLRTLDGATIDWDVAHQHLAGEIRAGDLLASWAAHDLLHIRQLIELRWKRFAQIAAPYDTRYAGEW